MDEDRPQNPAEEPEVEETSNNEGGEGATPEEGTDTEAAEEEVNAPAADADEQEEEEAQEDSFTATARSEPNMSDGKGQEASTATQTRIIAIKDYVEFLRCVGDAMGTADAKAVSNNLEVFCSQCDRRYAEEALQHLMMMNMMDGASLHIGGATSQGDLLRSGKCPACGHSQVRIVVSGVTGRLPGTESETRWVTLSAKLEGLDHGLVALEAAGATTRKTKWSVTGLILAVLCVYGVLIYLSAKNYQTDKLLKEIESRSMKVLPDLSTNMQAALVAVMPDFQREFEKQAEVAMPVLMEMLPEQQELLIDNVSKRVEERLRVGLETSMKRQEQKLMKTFPELKDEKKLELVSKHLQFAIQTATAELLHDRVERAVEAIIRVNEAVDKFKPEHIREEDRLLKDRLANVWDRFVGTHTTPAQ